MRARAITAVLIAAVAVGGCNSGDDPAIEVPSTTTTTGADESTTTSAAGAVTSTTAPAGRAASPELAAKGLFDAWRARDRARALTFGTERSVEALFDSGSTGGGMEYQGCEPEGGQFSCAWRYEGGGLIMTVQNAPEAGYVVELARFVVD